MNIADLTTNSLVRKSLLFGALTMASLYSPQPAAAFDECPREMDGQCDGLTPASMCMCAESGCGWYVEEQCQS